MSFKSDLLAELNQCLFGRGPVPVRRLDALAGFADYVRDLAEDDVRLTHLANVDQGSGSFWHNDVIWRECVPEFGILEHDYASLLDRMLDEAIRDEVELLEIDLEDMDTED